MSYIITICGKCLWAEVKNLTYTSLVRLVVEYSSPVWNPSKKQQISQVKQIQRKVARYVFNDCRDRSPGAVINNMIDTLVLTVGKSCL